MNANELRVGNYIQSGRIWYLESSEDGTSFYKADSFGSNAIPTLLTEEWILKFGFKKAGTSFIHSCGLKYHSPGIQSGTTGYGNWFAWGIKPIYGVRYVHQLQNLYFALTGEELILKEQE